MKRWWVYLVGVGVVIFGAIEIHHEIFQRHQVQALSKLGASYLRWEAELPSHQADMALQKITAPGTEAARLSAWILQQDRTVQSSADISSIQANVSLRDVTISGSNPVILSAQFSLSRHFYPKGQNSETGLVSFWISQGVDPVIEAVSFNTDQIQTTTSKDSFDLNIWNLIPAAPLPHGN